MNAYHFLDPHLEPVFSLFKFHSFLALCVGGGVGVFLTLFALYFLPKIGFLDFPERYGLKRPRLPYPGGVLFVLLLPLLFFIDQKFAPLALGGLLLGGVSFLDDRHQVSAKIRLMIHLGLAALIWFLGVRIDWVGDPFHATNISLESIPLISFGITVIWVVALQNALNWFDGIKGLAVGISAVGFFTLGLLGLLRPELFFDTAHHSTTFANLALAGLCTGSVWWYLKGKILLGDSGSQVFGFLLAGMAIISGAKIATTLLVLGLPILDFGVVIIRRMLIEKRSPFKGDLNHSHHLLAHKIGEEKTTWLFIGISFLFGMIAVVFTGFEKMIALGIVGLFILVGLVWLLRQR